MTAAHRLNAAETLAQYGRGSRRLLRVAAARRDLRRIQAQGGGDLHGLRQQAAKAVGVLRREVGRPAGPSAAELAGVLTQLADLHAAAVDLDGAIAALDEALRLRRHTDAAARCDLLVRRGHVHRLRADYESSRADLTACLAAAPEDLRRAGALNALGILEKDLGRFDEAEALYDEALTLVTALTGADSSALAALEHNLAGLAHARGRHDDGLPHIRRSLALRAATPGGPAPADVLSDETVLLALLAGTGDLFTAERLARRLVEDWTRLRGPDHYEVGHVRHHLGGLLERRGDPVAALEQFVLALRCLEATLGPSHPEVAEVRAAVAQTARLTFT